MPAAGELRCVDAAIDGSLHGFVPVTPEAEAPRCAKAALRCFSLRCSISFEEFRQTWKLLSSHLKTEISGEAIADLAQSIDFNKDGSIDINEFMEAFRLVQVPSTADPTTTVSFRTLLDKNCKAQYQEILTRDDSCKKKAAGVIRSRDTRVLDQLKRKFVEGKASRRSVGTKH
ncbi:unnamed protein product [Pleuronectes platessa]|uniref:EF-hand domain-containing protein n=1 Tax=Pleuronectes platessa TaxID=8262 RepID=A0A9N7Z6R9_PLEPL|nr:unnamed protein product [Pleuronectes platessa]